LGDSTSKLQVLELWLS